MEATPCAKPDVEGAGHTSREPYALLLLPIAATVQQLLAKRLCYDGARDVSFALALAFIVAPPPQHMALVARRYS